MAVVGRQEMRAGQGLGPRPVAVAHGQACIIHPHRRPHGRIAQSLGAGGCLQHQRLRALVLLGADPPQVTVHGQAGIGARIGGQGQDQVVHARAACLQGDARR